MTAGSPAGPHPTDLLLLRAYGGTRWGEDVHAEVAAGEVPGVTLYRYHNVTTSAQVRELTDALQAARPAGEPPLLAAADQEGGQFLALGDDTTPFAGNLALGAVDDLDLTERVGAAIGREAAACGVNLVYAPDVDLLDDPTNPAIGLRSFGDDADRVAAHAAAFVRGLRAAGVAATVKHFPGKGSVAVDTHHHLGVSDRTRDQLDARELAVARAAIQAGVEVVMSGHFAVPALTGRDDLPATLAPAVMRDLLRDELGFDGVAITDALDMGAVSQGSGQIVDALAALAAGVDLLLCGADPAANARLRDGLRLAWSRGLLDVAGVTASTERVRRLRQRLGEGSGGRPGIAAGHGDGEGDGDLEVVGCSAHRELAHELARRSVTLVRDEAGTLPLRPGAEVLVVQPRHRDLTPAETSATVEPTLGPAVATRFDRVRSLVLDDPPSDAEVEGVLAASAEADAVVVGVTAAWQEPAQRRLVERVLATGVPTVVVAMRSPVDAVALDAAPAVVCSYGFHPPSTHAVADVLAGKREAAGQLPVDLAGLRRAVTR